MVAMDFNRIFSDLKAGIEKLAKDNLKEFSKEASTDGFQVLNDSKTKLQKWAVQVSMGEMSKEDLEFLIKGEKDLMAMAALQKKGLAQIQIDKFKDGICSICVKTIFGIK